MTDLDELLHQDARRWQADFQPPELAPMVATATRSAPGRARWAWPILAAVLLLAIPLGIAVLRQSQHRPTTNQPASPGLKLFGAVPWLYAVVQPDPHSVSVSADIDKLPGCLYQLPVLKADVAETATSVTVRVQAYLPADYQPPTPKPGTALGCTAVGHHPVPVLATLHDPLGSRTLIDASTGQSERVTQAAALPAVTRLPAGYVDAGISAGEGDAAIEHSYRSGDTLLSLIRSGPDQQVYPINRTELAGTVLGHPAKVGSFGTGPGQIRCATWSDSSYRWQLCSLGIGLGDSSALLPATELLAAANSIR